MKHPLSQWMSVCTKAAAVLTLLGAMTVFAPSASAQCFDSDLVDLATAGTHNTVIDGGTGQVVPDSAKNFNSLAIIFRAGGIGRSNGCLSMAADKLKQHLIEARQKTGSQQWQQFLSGAYVVYVMAAAMEISGRGYMSEELDLLVRDVGNDYQVLKFAGDPCGLTDTYDGTPPPGLTPTQLANLKQSRRANSCMDDWAIAASGLAWKAAYWRDSTRYWQGVRNDAVLYMRKALSENDAVCVHSPSQYTADGANTATYFEAPACNKWLSDLDTGGDAFVISINHGNQAPAYGFGLLTSIAAGAVAFEVMNAPLNPAGEFSSNDMKAMKYLWKEAAEHTTATGRFHSNAYGDASCFNMAGYLTAKRTLAGGWGCEDQQFAYGDATEGTTGARNPNPGENLGYDAHWYPLATFYDRYGFTKVTGNGYSFSTFQDPNGRFSVNDPFYGPARLETYKTLSSEWFNARPPLTARSEFRLSINTYNSVGGRYFYATNGGGSTVVASAASSGVTNTNFELVDLTGATFNTGDRVAVRVTNETTGQVSYLTAPAAGGLVSATATNFNGNTEQFYIEKVGGSSGTLISHLDYFALRSLASNKYVEAVSGGGGNIQTSPTTVTNFARFKFIKTELPRKTY